MRLLICAGGTGGGVYPALSVLHALKENDQEAGERDALQSKLRDSILWVGSAGGMEADLVKRAGLQFREISAAGVHGVGLRALPGNLARLARGYREALRILEAFRPEVLFFTGGYVAVPMALAGRRLRSVLYVPDIEPGLALKTIAHFSDQIAVTTEGSRRFFNSQKKVTVTGYPIRTELRAWDRDQARRSLGLSEDLPTLLVFGGSTGARSINQALLAALPQLLNEMQVVHIAGQLDWAVVEASRLGLAGELKPAVMERYHAYPYLHEEMGAALAAADLALSRAGASVLGEFPLFGLPAILVPYPHAWRYQKVNAQFLAQQGVAVILEDAELLNRLLPLVRELIHDRIRLDQMADAMRSLARPDAARAIARLLRGQVGDLVGRGSETI
jgi:UDP-N-acetylglucosamine--N-acetylmuramyl-(pentapeptide) pyrophosphoryl-undecaprenol N-acetylglucosamine transferase